MPCSSGEPSGRLRRPESAGLDEMEQLQAEAKAGERLAGQGTRRFDGTAFLATAALPVVPKPADGSGLDAFGQALRGVELLQFLVGGADAKAKLAKAFALDFLLVRPHKHFAFIEPKLHHLLAVLGEEVGLDALGFVGAAEKSANLRP